MELCRRNNSVNLRDSVYLDIDGQQPDTRDKPKTSIQTINSTPESYQMDLCKRCTYLSSSPYDRVGVLGLWEDPDITYRDLSG